jgi:hypothetical protein
MNTNTQKTNGLKVKTNVKAGGWRINHNQTVAVDEPFTDLEAANAGEIKGGPRLIISKAGTFEEEGLADLEPTGDVIGGQSGSVEYLNRTRQKELLTLTYTASLRNNNEDKIAS